MVYHAARAPVIHGEEYNLQRDPVSMEVIGAVEQQLAAHLKISGMYRTARSGLCW